jgi:DNA-binding LacI/PurR family transcriptional regulator
LTEDVLGQLRKLIAPLPRGSKLPTIRQLTSQFGVSQHVLQRAFEQLRSENLVTSHVGKGTFVGGGEGSTAASYRILTLLYQHPYYRGDIVARNIHQRLSIEGHKSLILTYSSSAHAVELLQGGGRFDTCIVQPRSSLIPISLISLLKQRSDHVLIEAFAADQLDVDSVSNDPDKTVRLILDYLERKGHQRVAWITEDGGNYFFERTAQLFDMYCRGANREPDACRIVKGETDVSRLGLRDLAGELAALKGKARKFPFSAVVVASFVDGETILKAFEQIGLTVPDDICVVRIGSPDLVSDHMNRIAVVGRSSTQAAETVLDRMSWRWQNPDAPFRPYYDTPEFVSFD